jgi:uncharacterized lipoprotein YddW (UPF0748 family)
MDRRTFMMMSGMTALSMATRREYGLTLEKVQGNIGKPKHWAWITTDLKTSLDEWKQKFSKMRRAGIQAILPEIYNSRKSYYASRHLPNGGQWLEQILPLAKAEGIEVHAWMWSMPCNVAEIVEKHPDWFAVNGLGESAATKPAYVNYYKFMCPSHPEVREFVRTTVSELAQMEALTGIHLDYIRYPDVILAEALQPKYHIVQDKEYPQYDYCYCERCREEFKKRNGIDPLKMNDPSANEEWRNFRYERITRLVNEDLIPVAHQAKKQITAAVFPNWENVRQQWPVWKLDAVLPMLYHRYYQKDIPWIQEQVSKGVKSLSNRIPLYSGLFVPSLNPDELAQAVEASMKGGASGVSLFNAGSMTDAHWERFGRLQQS